MRTHCITYKNEDVAALDLWRGARVTVAELGWDVHLPFVAFHHQLHRFSPAFDHLVWCKRCWGSTIVRRVKGGAVNELTRVVALARRAGGWVRVAVTLSEDLVLHARGKSDHAVFAGVFSKKGLASFVGACGRQANNGGGAVRRGQKSKMRQQHGALSTMIGGEGNYPFSFLKIYILEEEKGGLVGLEGRRDVRLSVKRLLSFKMD